MNLEPGISCGLSFEDYRALDAASSHALSTLLDKSPAHLRGMERAPSAAMALGTAVHMMLMEPARAAMEIAVAPECDRRTKAGKSDWEEFQSASTDKLILAHEQFDTASRMCQSVMGHSVARILFEKGQAELTMVALDDETGLLCKGRLDWLPTGHDVLIDLKTTKSAAPHDVARDAARYAYHQQAAFYSFLWEKLTNERRPFLFVFIESCAPFSVSVFELDEDALRAGERRYRKALQIWAECKKTGRWHDYLWNEREGCHEIGTLSLPKWALS